jgi:F-type H+-transporting ATPase subunit gamma
LLIIDSKFVTGEYDKIELIYNQFKNAATQIVQVAVLPLAAIKSDLTVSNRLYF